MKYPISTDVIGLRGNALGCRGIVKAFVPDDHYEVFFPGLGQYTVAESTIMSVDEFKALRDDLAQARQRIDELEAVCQSVISNFMISYVNRVKSGIRVETNWGGYYAKEESKHEYDFLARLLDSLPDSR